MLGSWTKWGCFAQKMRDFRGKGGIFREKMSDFPLKGGICCNRRDRGLGM